MQIAARYSNAVSLINAAVWVRKAADGSVEDLRVVYGFPSMPFHLLQGFFFPFRVMAIMMIMMMIIIIIIIAITQPFAL